MRLVDIEPLLNQFDKYISEFARDRNGIGCSVYNSLKQVLLALPVQEPLKPKQAMGSIDKRTFFHWLKQYAKAEALWGNCANSTKTQRYPRTSG